MSLLRLAHWLVTVAIDGTVELMAAPEAHDAQGRIDRPYRRESGSGLSDKARARELIGGSTSGFLSTTC